MNCAKTCFAVLAIALTLTGCDTSQPHNQLAAILHYQRFVPIPADSFFTQGIPWHGYFALDTKTGTLCKTMKRDFRLSGPNQWANDIPGCVEVLGANPD